MDWETLSSVLSSEKRVKVIKSLAGPTTPSRIAKETGVSKAHASRILKFFLNTGIAECKTPNKKKGKIFILTARGKEILENLAK